MRYRINQIKLNMNEDHSDLADAVRRKLRKKKLEIYDIEIIRESVDARNKPDIRRVYTLDFSCDRKLPLEKGGKQEYEAFTAEQAEAIAEAKKKGSAGPRPVVAGFGPCGIFAALILAEAGLEPIVLERGEPVDERIKTVEKFWEKGILNTESNVQFGEGGAGTFSDGKLTTGIKDVRIGKVLEEFVAAGADTEILYKHKPHIGTDKLRGIVKNLREKIRSLGGEIHFSTKLESLDIDENNELKGINAVSEIDGGKPYRYYISADCMILAVGHSARDTFEMLYEAGLEMEQKPFSIGVRIEHPQEMIDRAQYGDPALAAKLGAADYKLNHRCENGRGVYTFCMCPGGEVINASSESASAVTNGMSFSGRDSGTANSGLLTDVRTSDFSSDHPLAGVEFQRKYEKLAYEQGKGWLPKSTYGNFRDNCDDPVRKSLPGFAADSIIEAMPFLGRKLRGFDDDGSVLTAVETRSSSPVRILRDKGFESSVTGIYPAGEGPGYAGGIMSAAADGIRAAEMIIEKKGRQI